MDSPFLGAIFMFGGNFAPQGYAFCDGSLLPISANDALFTILGTTYGGDGQTTFGLPNLLGRFAIHADTAAGNSYQLGQPAGTEAVTLTTNQLASHTHTVNAVSGTGDQTSPVGNLWAAASVPRYAPANTLVPFNAAAIGTAGNSQPHDNMPPFVAINFIIALQGVYPTQ